MRTPFPITLVVGLIVLLLGVSPTSLTAAEVPAGDSRAVCHDSNWEPAEFCGHDAFVTVTEPEMNHDCVVDFLDLQLFAYDYGKMAPNLSGDLDGDGWCRLFYDFYWFAPLYGDSVSPCVRGGMLPDTTQGSIWLSFSDDPANRMSSATIPSFVADSVYCVISGYEDLAAVEYAIETSPNLVVLGHERTITGTPPDFQGTASSDPDEYHSYRGTVCDSSHTGGPKIAGVAFVMLIDDNPGWIRLTNFSYPAGPDCFLRWSTFAANRSFFFEDVSHAQVVPEATGVVGEGFATTGDRPALRTPRPNPMRGPAKIVLELPTPLRAEVTVYDVHGRAVATLASGYRAAGLHTLAWSGAEIDGRHAPAGVYFARLETRMGSDTVKFVLLR